MTGKQRMLNAYRGEFNDRVAIAPEFWYYYPAKLLDVDMIAFEREVPFHEALKTTFDRFGCEGWGIAFSEVPNDAVQASTSESWVSEGVLEVATTTTTPHGDLASRKRYDRHEPSWLVERPIKDLGRDLAAWEAASLGGSPEDMDLSRAQQALDDVGDAYLLEFWMGVPFFDFFAGDREGGFETGIFDFMNPDFIPELERLQERYTDWMVRLARTCCERTTFESFCIGCSWSCNSLIGPDLWRRWDKPVIRAVANEVHRHGRLLHIHFHGRCLETVEDFPEIGVDCVCPFERPPGGDVKDAADLRQVASKLAGRTTMNGNVHTVETLIRGNEEAVRGEVREIMEAYHGNPRIILGTGDQVGRETPEANLRAMIDEAIRLSPRHHRAAAE